MPDPAANPFAEVLAIRGRLAKARTKQARPAELARRYAHDVGLLIDVVDELAAAIRATADTSPPTQPSTDTQEAPS